jgi:hypothetical protein
MPLYMQSLSIFEEEYLKKKREIKIQNITVNLEIKKNSCTKSKISYSKNNLQIFCIILSIYGLILFKK